MKSVFKSLDLLSGADEKGRYWQIVDPVSSFHTPKWRTPELREAEIKE